MTSRSKQTLGQVNADRFREHYEARRSVLDGEMLTWDELDTEGQEDWQAAAEAVARECWDRGVVLPEVSAVIEAAKLFLALEPFRYRCLDYDQQQAVIAVLKTARALQEGE